MIQSAHYRQRLLGLLIVSICSFIFQFALWGYEGGDRATTSDTSGYLGYLEVATSIQQWGAGEAELSGHMLRTPGYPLLIVAAAELSGVVLAEVELPFRNWQETNEQGRELVRQIIVLQCILGFLIPLLVYAIVLALGLAVPIAILAAAVYFIDMPSVAFQYVLLNETLSLVAVLATLLSIIVALRRQLTASFALAGLIASVSLIIRPPLAVLPALFFLIMPVLLYHGGLRGKAIAIRLGVFVAAVAILPMCWSLLNLKDTGSLFLTKNGSLTLQNFAGRHFAELNLDSEDEDLKVLQRHVAAELERRALNNSSNTWYAMSSVAEPVVEELGLNLDSPEDIVNFVALMDRANRLTILANPLLFAKGTVWRWINQWTRPLTNVKNRYVYARLGEFGIVGSVLAYQQGMLFGGLTLFLLLVLVPTASWQLPLRERLPLLTLMLFTLAYTAATALFDENEPVRHSLQVRIIVNLLLVAAMGILIPKLFGTVALWRGKANRMQTQERHSGL